MRTAVHIGRVGGLAVALGVGCAVVAGAGVAGADTTDTDSKTRTSEYSKKRTESESSKRSAENSARGSAKESPSESTKDAEAKDEPDAKDKDKDKDQDDTGSTNSPADEVEVVKDKGDRADKDQDTRKTGRKSDTSTSERRDQATADAEPRDTPQPQKVKAVEVRQTVHPTATVATAPAAPEKTVTLHTSQAPTHLVAQVLNSVTLATAQNTRPWVPQQSSLLMTLLSLGTRRDTAARTLTTDTAPAAAVATPLAKAAVTAPVTTRIGWLTGAGGLNDTAKRFGIAGTDVGVMWDNGITKDNPATAIVEQRQVLIAFGDTFSGPRMTGAWRNNVLLRSADNVLSNGLYVPNGIIHDPGSYSGSPMTNPNFSREIIGKYGYAVGPEVTIIPTAAISVPGAGVKGATRQYVNFMSVRSWDTPGRWTTNYSGVIWSDDNGQNWTVVPASGIRPAAAGRSTRPFINGNQNFQQGAYVKPPAGSADAAAGWVYSYGTPAGRGGTVYVSRVNDKQILDQTKYEYWNGSSWVKNNPASAKPVLAGTTTSSFFGLVKKTTYPTAGEMSVQYNPYLKKYVMLYTDSGDNVVMRTSATPQSGWSAPKTLATSAQYPGLYAPMIHPWSGSTLLKKADGTNEDPAMLYWNLSQWNEYNVALMRTDLSRV